MSGLLVPARTTTLVAVLNPGRTWRRDTSCQIMALPALDGDTSHLTTRSSPAASVSHDSCHTPSISTNSWFNVFSCSLCPPKFPRPRFRPTASISSMKRIQGAFFRAMTNKSRTCKGSDIMRRRHKLNELSLSAAR